jgi:recombination protein RecA
MEEMIDDVYGAIEADTFNFIGIDSIAALLPKIETTTDADKANMGIMGKLTSQMTRKFTAPNQTGITIVYINQIRDNLGISWGTKKPVTPGGRAIPFYASQRVEFRRGAAIKEKVDSGETTKKGNFKKTEKTIGRMINVLIEKDKTSGNEQATAVIPYIFKRGTIDRAQELFDVGIMSGVLKRNGMSVVYKEKGAKGRDSFIKLLRKDKELAKSIRSDIMTSIKELD